MNAVYFFGVRFVVIKEIYLKVLAVVGSPAIALLVVPQISNLGMLICTFISLNSLAGKHLFFI